MLEIIPSPPAVIAIKVSHKVTGEDLDSIMDRVDDAMAASEKVQVFVETQSIDGVELSGLGSYAARAMPLFGKLSRFDRIAVVADQAWIRVATRLESAVLPHVSYRVYLPEERDEALAWVMGGPDS